jgi:AMP phosphorylase
MEVRVRFIKWSAGLPVAMLSKKTAEELGVHSNDRISIKTLSKKPKEISTVIDIIEKVVKKGEIAVSFELGKMMNLRKGQKVDINLALPPKSMVFIKKKLRNKTLSEKQMQMIVDDVVNNSLSEPEIALFVSGIYKYGMNMREIIYLIKAIQKSGNKLRLNKKLVVDKHSVGGVPGNRTTPIIVPICAVAGLTMPKNSSRAITSAAGTADVIETIAKVEFSISELKKIIRKTNACMVWGGALGLVPADAKIIKVEKSLRIDPKSQLVASIMSKKLAAGSKYILIDIPYGKNAKVTKAQALNLKKRFDYLGKYFHKKLKCVLTDGNQPIGNGIGPVLELEDIIRVLDPKQEGPEDLEEKSLMLAGELLEMTGKAKKGQGRGIAEGILHSGKAFEKFKQIIKAQKGSLKNIKPGRFKKEIKAKKSGKIVEIQNKKITSIARTAGCPSDKSAGIYLCCHVRDKVKRGQKILTIYSVSKPRLKEAFKLYKKIDPIKIR